jgi:hypothetical protein
MQEFSAIVMKMTQEYIAHDGYITCEFSTDKSDEYEKEMVLFYADNCLPMNADWHIFECETCKKHDPSKPYHVEIRSK